MKHKNFELNKKFANFLYHALAEKLYVDSDSSEYLDQDGSFDRRATLVLGDFFEQILGIDRNNALRQSYERIGKFFGAEQNLSDPAISHILYSAEILKILGEEELEFDEIYPKELFN